MRYFPDKFHVALVAALAATEPAVANDTLAVLESGGLELTTSDDIVMESEDLFLSTSEVRVRYVFTNESDEDITTRVAFPLPDVPFGPADNVDLPDREKDNFVDFSVTVDGQTIEPELEQRAISTPTEFDDLKPSSFPVGSDMTEAVRESGLPLNANLTEWQDAVSALPEGERARLVERGVLYPDSFGPDSKTIETYGAQWSLRETYHWEQTFPAGKPIVVEHRYRPVVGGAYYAGDDGDLEEIRSEYGEQYCLDKAGSAGVQRLLKKVKAANARNDGASSLLLANQVGYILTTGANWKGVIGQFKLTIDKRHADAVLSTCVEGLKKTGPTTFEVQRKNFTPAEDIRFITFSANDR